VYAAGSASSAFAKELEAARGAGVLALHDVVLWGGDLNYRINGTPGAVKHLIDSGMAEVGLILLGASWEASHLRVAQTDASFTRHTAQPG
jgi:hypothetical protein